MAEPCASPQQTRSVPRRTIPIVAARGLPMPSTLDDGGLQNHRWQITEQRAKAVRLCGSLRPVDYRGSISHTCVDEPASDNPASTPAGYAWYPMTWRVEAKPKASISSPASFECHGLVCGSWKAGEDDAETVTLV